jgi:hypothetical protein
MMTSTTFAVPESVSFEAAIALTQQLLTDWEQQALSPEQIQTRITQLVASQNGARGFFVTYLTDERSQFDAPTDAVLAALCTSAETVSELLVKNLAMSTAMAIAHRRNGNEAMAQGSDRVRSRTVQLIQQLSLDLIPIKADQLRQSVTGEGPYQSFLDRWGYDAEQRDAIAEAVNQAIATEATE